MSNDEKDSHLPTPAKFDPSNKQDNANAFISRYDLYAKVRGWDNDRAAQCIGLFLGTPALNWYRTLAPEIQQDYEQIKTNFLQTFASEGSTFSKFQLMAREQKKEETLEEYLTDIFSFFNNTSYTEDDKIVHFTKGLPLTTKFYVLGTNPKSLLDAINAAKLHESMQSQLDAKKNQKPSLDINTLNYLAKLTNEEITSDTTNIGHLNAINQPKPAESEMRSSKKLDSQEAEQLNMMSQINTQNSGTDNLLNRSLFQMSDCLGRLESDLKNCKEDIKCLQDRFDQQMFTQENNWNEDEIEYFNEEEQ